MVNYKVRVFCEPEDEDSLGAEVRIYNEEGDTIDTILITTESQYRQLAEQIENMDNTYIDMNELTALLSNTENNQLNINATTLDGLNSSDFAKLNHNEQHQGVFAPVAHASTNNKYGLATGSNYGHVKTIDNLTTASNVSGEALSAYQGNILNTAINNLKKSLTTWTKQSVGKYGTLRVNTALRLCRFSYVRENYKIVGDKVLHSGYIPKEYCPGGVVRAWDSKYVMLSVNSSGDVELATNHSSLPITNTLRCHFKWFY